MVAGFIADYLKFPSKNPTVGLPCKEYPTENSHLFRYPSTSGDSSIPSNLHGRPPECKDENRSRSYFSILGSSFCSNFCESAWR